MFYQTTRGLEWENVLCIIIAPGEGFWCCGNPNTGINLADDHDLTVRSKSRKENPQKLTQLSSRSHPRHLVGKRTAQKDITIDTTSDSQVNSNFPNRWSPASLTFNNYFYLFLYLYITFFCTIKIWTVRVMRPCPENRWPFSPALQNAWDSLGYKTNIRPGTDKQDSDQPAYSQCQNLVCLHQ